MNRPKKFLGKQPNGSGSHESWSEEYAFYDTDGITKLEAEQLPLARAIQGEIVKDREMILRREDKNVLISVDAKPLGSESVRGGVCVFRDITDERAREHQMRMLREAVDHAHEAMFTVDSNERFVGVNKFACKRLGYSQREFLSLTVSDICHDRPFDSWHDQWNHLKAKRNALLEAEYISKDGEIFPVEVSLMFVNYDGEEFIYAFARDITQRKQADAERAKLARELQTAARYSGMAEVATGVLHNVGNILNSVNVSTSVIRKRFEKSAFTSLQRVTELISEHQTSFADFVRDDQRGQKIPAYIQKVTAALADERAHVNLEFDDLLKNVDHVKEIVSVQQSMAKSSGVNQMLAPQDLVQDLLTATKGSLVNHRIQVIHEVDDEVPNFESDKHKILQILINLIENAKDAMVEHKTENPQIRIDVLPLGNEQLVFRVADNGIGIASEKMDKIFQHGFTTKEYGHGFGLHSCANAATELDGKLTVASDGIGQGATFELALPNKQGNKKKLSPASP